MPKKEITEQELRSENPDPDAFKTASHISNQFPGGGKSPAGKEVQQANKATLATKKKWSGWFFGK